MSVMCHEELEGNEIYGTFSKAGAEVSIHKITTNFREVADEDKAGNIK